MAVPTLDLRYVSYSRPGYGSSSRRPGRAVVDVVEDCAAILDAIGADRCYLLGWSGGVARSRLLAEHGHLSLAVDSFPRIVDDLMAAGQ